MSPVPGAPAAAASRASRLARNSMLSFIGLAVPSVIGIVTIPLIVGGLGPERFGVLALVWMVLGYLGTFDLGMGRATTRFVARALHDADPDVVPRIVGTTFAVVLPFGLATGALLAALTPWISGHVLHLSGPLAAEMSGAFYVLAVAIPVSQVSVLLRGILEAFHRFDLVNAVKVPAGAASFVLPLVGVWLHLSLPEIVVLLLLSRTIVLLVYLTLCRSLVPGRGLAVSGSLFGSLFSFGGWTTVSAVAQQLQSYLERFVLGHLLGIVSVTYYSAPLEAISRLSIVPASLAAALFPDVSRRDRAGGGGLAPIMARSIKYLLLALVPVVGVAIVFMVDLLTAWLGPDFVWAVRSSCILLLCSVLSAIGYVPLTVLYGQGAARGKAVLDLLELPLFALLCAWLIPTYGLEGAASARLLVQVLDLTTLFAMVRRITGIRARGLLAEGCGPAVVLCTALAVGAIALVLVKPGLGPALAWTAGGLAVFVLLVLRTATDERDWMLLAGARRPLERLGIVTKTAPETRPDATP